jgi:transmembrane sensor
MEKPDNIQLLERFFRGDASKPEVESLLHRLQDVQFEKTWMEGEWEATSTEMNVAVQHRVLKNINEQLHPQKQFPLKRWLSVAAAVVLLCVSSTFAYLFFSQDKALVADMNIEVSKGQKAKITLPDGSKVWINSNTMLSYGARYNANERIIHLDGEAYFEVAPNKKAPFIVESQGFSVRAVGTAFDVKAYRDEPTISTVLVHGSVVVSDQEHQEYLQPNQKMVYDCRSRSMRKSNVEDCALYAGWKENQLNFQSETLENVAKVLERNYNVRLVFESEALKNYRYSGSLGNTSLETVLQIFSMTSPMTYHSKDSVIYLRENKQMMSIYRNVTKR